MILRFPSALHSVALLAFAAAALAQDVKITSGLTDYQVIQRGVNERAEISVGGTGGVNGRYVEARVLAKGTPLTGFDWKVLDKVNRAAWSGVIKDVPTGGPYRVEVRQAGSTTIVGADNVLVGDLWVLAGQSNMQGVGDLVDVQQPSELIHSFDMTDRWMLAVEPLHTLVNAVDRVHWPLNEQKQPERYTGDKLEKYKAERKKGAGLGLPFATFMLQRTGVPIGLIPCAHGGTSMEQWDPARKSAGGDSLYGSMLRRVKAVGGKVKGVLWYQGESDANPKVVGEYQTKLERLVAAIRDDFGQADLPFYYVQLGRHISNANQNEWNQIQEMQRKVESTIPRVGMVPAVDLALDDAIHIGTGDLKRLGLRLSNLAVRDLFGSMKDYGKMKRGPRPVSAVWEGGVIKVSFAEVNGKLTASGRIAGFSVHDAKGEAVPAIYKALLDPQDPNTILLFVGKLPEGATLRYGAGKDPYCNVTDSIDMGMPAFGPMPISIK